MSTILKASKLDDTLVHYGQWWAVALFVAIFSVFLAFIPFYQKSQRRPSGTFFAFVLAFAFEMFGVPFSMYVVTWIFGFTLPTGILWGHTLRTYIGDSAADFAILLSLVSLGMVIFGWREIHKQYWSREKGEGKLVTTGIYRYVRHPQYTGFLLVTLGMLVEWATIPLLIMWPILVVLYYRLARREEAEMEKEFGNQYIEYKKKTSMFVPLPRLGQSSWSGIRTIEDFH